MNDDKRLIENSLSIEATRAAASREKSVRRRHASTLHLWWARYDQATHLREPLTATAPNLCGDPVDRPSHRPSPMIRARRPMTRPMISISLGHFPRLHLWHAAWLDPDSDTIRDRPLIDCLAPVTSSCALHRGEQEPMNG